MSVVIQPDRLEKGFNQDLRSHLPSVAGVPKQNSLMRSQDLDYFTDWKTLTRSSGYARERLVAGDGAFTVI